MRLRGFVRDEYTTLPDITNRPLHMWLDLEWKYTEFAAAFNGGVVVDAIRRMTHDLFDAFESGSIQEVIYQLGTRILLLSYPRLRKSTWRRITARGTRS